MVCAADAAFEHALKADNVVLDKVTVGVVFGTVAVLYHKEAALFVD